MTALPNLFATTAHDHSGPEGCRADVFAPDDHAEAHLSPCELFSTEPHRDDHHPAPAAVLTTDPTAPSWMPELLATVDADPDDARPDTGRLVDVFGEAGSIDLRGPRRADASTLVVRRRRRNRRHGALRRLRPSWTSPRGTRR